MKNPLKSGEWRARDFYRAARRTPPVPSSSHPAMTYRMPRHLVALKAWLSALVVGAVITVLYVVFWFSVAASLRGDVTDWTAARRAEGYTVEYRHLEVGGFPFHLRATLTDARLAMPPGAPPWSWEGGTLVVEGRPWSVSQLTVSTPGRQTVGLPIGGTRTTYRGTAERLEINLVLTDGFPWEAVLRIAGLDFAPTGPGAGTFPPLKIGTAEGHARRTFKDTEKDVSFELRLKADGLTLPFEPSRMPLGTDIARLDLAADLTGPFPTRFDGESLGLWRDAGGTLEIRHLATLYGPLDIGTNGTLALDEAMQPVGAFTAKASGFFQAVDALEKRGIVRDRDAVTAKLVLSAMSKRPKDGGPPTISLPLTVQNRRIFAGPVPLIAFDPVEWPGADAPDSPARTAGETPS